MLQLAFLEKRRNPADDLISWREFDEDDELGEASPDEFSEVSSTDEEEKIVNDGDRTGNGTGEELSKAGKSRRKKKKPHGDRDTGDDENGKKKSKKKVKKKRKTEKYVDPDELHDMVHGSGQEGPKELTMSQKVKAWVFYHSLFLWVFTFYLIHVYIWWEFEYHAEWSIVQCIYFTTATLTTVGYGDISPLDTYGRLYSIFFILFGLVAVTSVLMGLFDDLLHQVEYIVIGKIDKGDLKIKQNIDADTYHRPSAFLRYRKIIFSITVIFLVIISGVIFMMIKEGWGPIEAVYWCVVTSTTVGFGDVEYAHDDLTLLFVSFYMLFSTMAVAAALSNLVEISNQVDSEMKSRSRLDGVEIMDILREPKYGFSALYQKVHDRHLTLSTKGLANPLKKNPKLHLGKVSKLDFVLFMIEKLHDLDREGDINPILKKFDDHDKDDTGFLDVQDLLMFIEAVARKKELRIASEEKRKRDMSIMHHLQMAFALIGICQHPDHVHVSVEDVVTSNAPKDLSEELTGDGKAAESEV